MCGGGEEVVRRKYVVVWMCNKTCVCKENLCVVFALVVSIALVGVSVVNNWLAGFTVYYTWEYRLTEARESHLPFLATLLLLYP